MPEFSEILKTGSISATDVTLSGELTPKQSRTFIETIVDKTDLLKEVTVDITGKLTKERSTYDIGKGVLNRHVSGKKVPDSHMTKLGKIGCSLDMTKGVSLNARILDDALEDNKDNPKFEKETFEGFATTFANDLEFLGIAGVDDNAAETAPFEELAKGWVQVAKESADAVKKGSSANSVAGMLKAVVNNLNEDIKGGKAVIFLSAQDYDNYQLEVAEQYPNSGALINAGINSFMGYKIKANNNLKQGEFLATLPKNMVFGITSTVKRLRWYDNEASCLRYKFVVFPDYEFDIHKYITLITYTPLLITSQEVSVKVGATASRTVQSAGADGIASVEVSSLNTDVATATYNKTTGLITITGVAVGVTKIEVDDTTSKKYIKVEVVA